jgi:carbamoyl-phosphate synthase large subunit
MPRREDLSTIMVLGSGPIVIGQAGEFDYSGTQACQALRAEGYSVVLVNSNPATIMTDPEVADRTYIEPLDVQTVAAIIAIERPDALLPTLGGQTALNLAMQLHRGGVLAEFGVELIGADAEAIHRAEDRQAFAETMRAAGIPVLAAHTVGDLAAGRDAAADLGYPLILRPAFTMGGEGGGVVQDAAGLEPALADALAASPIGQVLIERSVIGWGEFELEVVRDHADNAIVVCAIENLDPMGVHTGDSVTVAPAMTLTDTELQRMRDMALAVIRAVGVETGGSNVQFALDRDSAELAVIEMNPRVSRSSALASKATGFPIARVAARLAVGYTLDELPNEITGVTPASFEPALDYVAVKAPRFAFEKLPGSSGTLSTYMQSVGEVLALGRTFAEAYGKAMSGRELDSPYQPPTSLADALRRLQTPSWDRWDVMRWAAEHGADTAALSAGTQVHPWFCEQISLLARTQADIGGELSQMDVGTLRATRRAGLTDRDIAAATGSTDLAVGRRRRELGVVPTFHAVDTCAGEFAAETPYFYAAFASAGDELTDDRPSVIVLGSGPNRIGQGVEFDYCCVQAVQAVRALGYAAVMVNCNPETVSTDHGVSDRLYLEPVTLDSVLDICARERPVGVITQLGGQTPLRMSRTLEQEGVPLLGTSAAAIDLAEDRERFAEILAELGLQAPPWAIAHSADEAIRAAATVGFPVLVRPSYVLGGRAMAIVFSQDELATYLATERPSWPLLVDRFLEDAIELDVDALCDGTSCYVAAILEHVEAAGIHSGDSACVTPPQETGPGVIAQIETQTAAIAVRLGAVGLVNVQFALQDGELFVIEANPRASRTVPFVAKATGIPLVHHAVRLMLGELIADLDLPDERIVRHVAVKEAVLPFARFPLTDPTLGPEMRATGEVMGVGGSFGEAFAKAQRGAGFALPRGGIAVLSAANMDKPRMVAVAQRIARSGFTLVATDGTAAALRAAGLEVTPVAKLDEGATDIPSLIARGGVALVVNTPSGRRAQSDGLAIRQAAVRAGIPCITTMEAAEATADALRGSKPTPLALQDILAKSPHRSGRR